MKTNHFICPVCGYDFYCSDSYATCDACQCHFYVSESKTGHGTIGINTSISPYWTSSLAKEEVMGQVVTDEAYNELEVENDRLTQQVAKLKRKIDKLMTEPTNTDKARYVIERLGMCWHIPYGKYPLCKSCGKPVTDKNPTFLDPAGRIQLLELMMGRSDCLEFANKVGYLESAKAWGSVYIRLDYLTNTGLLLDAAYRFLKEKEGV
jgi:hypothetical protein